MPARKRKTSRPAGGKKNKSGGFFDQEVEETLLDAQKKKEKFAGAEADVVGAGGIKRRNRSLETVARDLGKDIKEID